MLGLSKVANLNEFVQGGQLYLAFHFGKGSLDIPTFATGKILSFTTNVATLFFLGIDAAAK
jgi:hypothetical protein